MNITASEFTEEMVDTMVRSYTRKRELPMPGWARVEINEDTKLYKNTQTGELKLHNPEEENGTERKTKTWMAGKYHG